MLEAELDFEIVQTIPILAGPPRPDLETSTDNSPPKHCINALLSNPERTSEHGNHRPEVLALPLRGQNELHNDVLDADRLGWRRVIKFMILSMCNDLLVVV